MRTLVGLAFLLLFSALAVWADSPDALILLHRAAETYRELKSFELTGTAHFNEQFLGRHTSIVRPLVLRFLRPARLRIDYRDGWGLIVSDGSFNWQYVAPANRYFKRPEKNGPMWPLYYADGEKIDEHVVAARVARQETLRVNGAPADCYVLEVTYAPRPPLPQPQNRTFWVDERTGLILRVSLHTTAVVSGVDPTVPPPAIDDEFDVETIAPDKPIPESLFHYSPPANALEGMPSGPPPPKLKGSSTSGPDQMVGQTAPRFETRDLDDKVISLELLHGKLVLLYFWETWCIPCRTEIPDVLRIKHDEAEKGLVVLGVNDEDRGKSTSYLQKNGWDLPSVIDPGGQIAKSFHVFAYPTLILIGRQGQVVWSGGQTSEEVLKNVVDQAARR